MNDLRRSIHQQSKEYEYTKEEIARDLKWGIRAILVIAFCVALKYFGTN